MITGLKIGEGTYFIDGASKFSIWNLLPEKCMVDKARIIHNGSGKWVDLSTISTGTIFSQGFLNFEDGHSVFNVKEAYGGNSSYDKRHELAGYENEDKYLQKVEENENCSVSDFSIKGNKNIYDRLEIEMVKTKEADLADFLYIIPPITKLYTENPFKSESREFPVNFDHLLNYVQAIEIEIPEGYEVVELPKSEQYVMPDKTVSYLYRVAQNGNKLILNVRYQLKTLMILPTEYEYIKDFFAKMISKNNEQIVLKKI